MKAGDAVFIVETSSVKQVDVLKVVGDFVTVKYKTYLPADNFGHVEKTGGIRIRRSRVFETKEAAEEYVTRNKEKGERIRESNELSSILNKFK